MSKLSILRSTISSAFDGVTAAVTNAVTPAAQAAAPEVAQAVAQAVTPDVTSTVVEATTGAVMTEVGKKSIIEGAKAIVTAHPIIAGTVAVAATVGVVYGGYRLAAHLGGKKKAAAPAAPAEKVAAEEVAS